MTKKLIKSLEEAIKYSKGDQNQGRLSKHKVIQALDIPESINLKSLRATLHMTQEEFAVRYGFNIHTLRNWEHGHRHPDKAVLSYLYAISKDPSAIEKVLRS